MTPDLFLLIAACLGFAGGAAVLGVLLWREVCKAAALALDGAARDYR